MVVAHDDVLVLLQGAPLDAADGDPAHEVVVVDGADQHLEGLVHICLRGGDILQNGLKQGLEVRARHVGGVGGGAVAAGAEQHGGIQLFRGGIQVHQQLQHLIPHLVDPLVGPVDLVDHHNDPVAQLQGLGEHEAGLGHGALGGVHQQDDAVDHLQDALHLAAEVGVARGIHAVDLGVLRPDGGVLCQDGDAPLPLQVAGVHDPVHHLLILPVDAALLQHLVHQRGFAVVDVGDDGDISQMFVLHNSLLLLLWQGRAGRRVQVFCLRQNLGGGGIHCTAVGGFPALRMWRTPCGCFRRAFLSNDPRRVSALWGSLAVVDVGVDGDVPQMFVLHIFHLLFSMKGPRGVRRAADQHTRPPCRPSDSGRRSRFAHSFALYAVLSIFASCFQGLFQKNRTIPQFS